MMNSLADIEEERQVQHGELDGYAGDDLDVGGGYSDPVDVFADDFRDPGIGERDWEVGGSPTYGLVDENAVARAQGSDFELNDAEGKIVQLFEDKIGRGRGRSAVAKEEKIYVTHEDFDEGPERDAFLLLYGYSSHLFDSAKDGPFVNNDKKRKALRFVFCHTLREMSMVDAVSAINDEIRVDVLRLRFMLEFWMRGWALPTMPEDADGLPGRVELMAAHYGDMIGIELAREAWFKPGIEEKELLALALEGRPASARHQVMEAYRTMVLNYVLSIKETREDEESRVRVYVTGKNPILEAEDLLSEPGRRVGNVANIYWSRRF